ncbi:MAG TPA: carboxypeptidase-like regulatory domain-containing protein [Vicinamibacterales bacterium]|nr:carboxypeptidase-like regulatory domain-containing protein [Vicinamibacterales bacterium]
MSIARSLWAASLLPLVLLVTPLPAAAQFSSALQGTITDTQQAFVPDAIVRVTNTTTGVTREATTSSEGVYRVPSLGAGVYTVEIEKAGFLKARRENLRLGISETLRLDFTLEVSGVAESVTVESNAPLVETEQGRVSGRVDRTLLQDDVRQRELHAHLQLVEAQ